MRGILCCLLLLLSFNSFASSQLIYAAQKKQIELTEKDKAILQIGEISTARYIVGGILGTYPLGFGIGHGIQGRWSEQGQIFTWGELGSLGVVVAAVSGCLSTTEAWNCSSFEEALILTGAIGFIGLRLWEIVDVWATPPSHNSKFRVLKKYIDETKSPPLKASLDLVPIVNPKFGQGLGLKYVF